MERRGGEGDYCADAKRGHHMQKIARLNGNKLLGWAGVSGGASSQATPSIPQQLHVDRLPRLHACTIAVITPDCGQTSMPTAPALVGRRPPIFCKISRQRRVCACEQNVEPRRLPQMGSASGGMNGQPPATGQRRGSDARQASLMMSDAEKSTPCPRSSVVFL